MNKTDIVISEAKLPTELSERIRSYISASKSPATIRSYRSALRSFENWCRAHGLQQPFPASSESVAAYLADRAQSLSVSTLQKHMAALNEAHRAAGFEPPTSAPEVQALLKGIRRTHGTASKGKSPLLVADLRRICQELPDSPIGHRDRALLLVGFAGALRRSELVALDTSDLECKEEGVVLTIRRSKTDQTGEGRPVGVPYGSNPSTCPVRAIKRWLFVLASDTGPLFRSITRHGQIFDSKLSDRAVALIVKKYVERIGLDPKSYSGHSLRAGLATETAKAGLDAVAISRQTGHRSLNTLRGYIRIGSLFTNNAAAAVGL